MMPERERERERIKGFIIIKLCVAQWLQALNTEYRDIYKREDFRQKRKRNKKKKFLLDEHKRIY